MTGPFSHDPFEDRRLGLEEEYFRSRDASLVGKLKSVFNATVSKEDLRATTGITDEALLDRLVAANLRGEMLIAFQLYPLVEIAWADGSLDRRESDAVINAAIKTGVPDSGPAMDRLRDWLAKGPSDDFRSVWKVYAEALRKKLSPQELATFRTDLLKYANLVAEASGGILGAIFAKGPSEQRVIEAITKHLTA
jgi:hypothetical protein